MRSRYYKLQYEKVRIVTDRLAEYTARCPATLFRHRLALLSNLYDAWIDGHTMTLLCSDKTEQEIKVDHQVEASSPCPQPDGQIVSADTVNWTDVNPVVTAGVCKKEEQSDSDSKYDQNSDNGSERDSVRGDRGSGNLPDDTLRDSGDGVMSEDSDDSARTLPLSDTLANHTDDGDAMSSIVQGRACSVRRCTLHRCSECNKAFDNAYKLTVHRRVHSGHKPFHCPTCDAAFKQRGI